MSTEYYPLDARRAAFEVLQKVELGAYSDLALDTLLKRNRGTDPRDRALLTELVYGILRLRGRLDFALAQVSRQPFARLESAAQQLLRIGAYQLLELERIPVRAAVNETVELARKLDLERLAGLVNGTLRELDRKRDQLNWPPPEKVREYLEQVCSLPKWLAREIMSQLPNEGARSFGEALSQAAPMSLRINGLKTDAAGFKAALDGAGFQYRECGFAPEGLIIEQRGPGGIPGDEEGWYQVQDEASMLIAHLLDPQPGEKILDACAAPGGKTTHIAALTGNRARILALEKHPQRVRLLEQGAARNGCTCIEARQYDLEEFPDFLEIDSFDRVLVDAPCSGLGVLRRNPESRWTRQAAELKVLAELQLKILFNVAPLVKRGGILLYSVCTFSRAETTGVIETFLENHREFDLESFGGQVSDHWQALLDPSGALRSFPHQHDGMDAFFAVKLRRQA
ncbi:16S rRNA (cytosine(967)-C(5))-methyltransferase RsmB [Geopsychrobacter electrodiphilus]|uniref:16S rRNA (cytosine(967)-C(5))-methyltransferase RsmB n=1 Tax=Geopsychrobacter electrodiphilus TaxID=225196 RepID=UPI00037B2D74|nr:16S rRNA (cytosine(967)-C(5))-methyltransferase RsmB [Geopsychrobacter electrodiphilus]